MNQLDLLTHRYLKAYGDLPFDQARRMFINYPQNVIFNEDMVIMFVRIKDETFNRIIKNPSIISEPVLIRSCYLEEGDYIYLLKAFGDARGFKKLIKRLQAAYEPQMISFHRDNLKRLHTVYSKEQVCHG